MPLHTDGEIATLLTTTQTIALEIASSKAHRDSFQVLHYLLACGYRVFPINPACAGQQICGQQVYAQLQDIPERVDLVDIFRRSGAVRPIVERAIAIGAGAIWMQLGVVNKPAATLAEAAGLPVVMDRCPAIDIPRFKALGLMS